MNLASKIEDGEARDRPEAEQHPPDDPRRDVSSEQDRSDERADDEARALHGKDEADHLSA